jgi:type II secretory ATPase GspE/PulE/Tfp pilus assembly ATPase PilB-like protein
VCNYKGYTGRIGIFEIFLIDNEISEAIYKGLSEEEVLNILKKQNFINLRQDGLIKSLLGLVRIEEILKIT